MSLDTTLGLDLLGRAQPVIPPNLYSMLMNIIAWGPQVKYYRFTTYQDARRVRLVDGLEFETNILRVSPVKCDDVDDIILLYIKRDDIYLYICTILLTPRHQL